MRGGGGQCEQGEVKEGGRGEGWREERSVSRDM